MRKCFIAHQYPYQTFLYKSAISRVVEPFIYNWTPNMFGNKLSSLVFAPREETVIYSCVNNPLVIIRLSEIKLQAYGDLIKYYHKSWMEY